MLATRWRGMVTVVVAVCLVLVACGDDDESGAEGNGEGGGEVSTGDPIATTTEPSTTTTTGATSTSEAGTTSTTGEEPATTGGDAPDPTLEDASTEARTGTGSGAARAQITDVRLGDREASDRFVVEFAGGELPDWEVVYEAGPITEAGSGRPVEVEGDAFLVIRMDGASGFDLDAGTPTYEGAERKPGPGPAIDEAVLSGDFEAVTSWVLGLDDQRPFAVTTLTSPSRLVVDVAV